MDLKDVVHDHDAEQKVERNAQPSHPLTEVHHPPYCKDNNPYLFLHQGKFVTFLAVVYKSQPVTIVVTLGESLQGAQESRSNGRDLLLVKVTSTKELPITKDRHSHSWSQKLENDK